MKTKLTVALLQFMIPINISRGLLTLLRLKSARSLIHELDYRLMVSVFDH